jgi:DNA polymerase-3 subunit delta
MKLEPRRIEQFLRDPGEVEVALFYGDDLGLIRERAARLVGTVAGSLDDPFRVAEIDRDGFADIVDQMASLSLTGGRRVVRVREAGDAVAAAVQAVIDRGARGFAGNMLVLEAFGLTARSKLRAVVERAPHGVAIGCYPQDGRSLEHTIREILGDAGVSIDPDAVTWLATRLGADRAVTHSEIGKLALFVGAHGKVDLEAARNCTGDLAGLSLDDALFAATSGNVAAADRALELAMAEGAAAVGVLRAALGHVHRLQRARAAMEGGATAMEAAKAVRPPVFFQRQRTFVEALSIWSPDGLAVAAVRLWDAERACKRTGAPAEALCRNAVIGLAHLAGAARRR